MRKGQAAMEFLMTYGWAILVVLVAIGALAYFGVLSPGKFLPETCILTPGFACEDFKLTEAGAAEVVIRNGGKDVLSSVTVQFQKEGGSPLPTIPGSCPDEGGDGTVSIGERMTCSASDAGLAGTDRFKGNIILAYTTEAGITHSKIGDFIVKYEK